MNSRLGGYFREVRLARGLSVGSLARQIGYQNVNKGCRRITTFERTGRSKGDLLSRLASALEIDDAMIRELRDADRGAWEEWADAADQPKPYVVLRLLPAIYSKVGLPDDVMTREDAEHFASTVAAQRGMQTCLVWNRRLTVWFDRDGTCLGVRESTFDQDFRPRAWIA
jgi:hypothetical protein